MFCKTCGNELDNQALICPKCGVPTDNYNKTATTSAQSTTTNIAKIFLIISCVFSIFSFFIPLAWCIPMTIHYYKTINKGEKVSLGFKICTLLFVSTISGILMLCEKE